MSDEENFDETTKKEIEEYEKNKAKDNDRVEEMTKSDSNTEKDNILKNKNNTLNNNIKKTPATIKEKIEENLKYIAAKSLNYFFALCFLASQFYIVHKINDISTDYSKLKDTYEGVLWNNYAINSVIVDKVDELGSIIKKEGIIKNSLDIDRNEAKKIFEDKYSFNEVFERCMKKNKITVYSDKYAEIKMQLETSIGRCIEKDPRMSPIEKDYYLSNKGVYAERYINTVFNEIIERAGLHFEEGYIKNKKKDIEKIEVTIKI